MPADTSRLIQIDKALRATLDATEDLVYSMDTSYRLNFCSRSYCLFIRETFGFHISEGDKLIDSSRPEMSVFNTVKALWDRALAGERFSFVNKVLANNGSVRHLEGKYLPIYNEDDRIIGMSAILRDITEKISYGNLLKELIGNSPLGIVVLRAMRAEDDRILDLEYLLVSPAAHQMMGFPEKEIVGKTVKEVFPGTVDMGIYDKYIRVIEQSEDYDEVFFYDADGIHSWYRQIARKNDDGLVVFTLDITREKENSLFLNSLLEAMPAAVFVFDIGKQKNIFLNRSYYTMFGYSQEQIEEMGSSHVWRMLHEDDLDVYTTGIQRLMEAKDDEVLEFVFRLLHHDGEYRWVKGDFVIFKRDSKGRPSRVLGTLEDITEEKRKEEQLFTQNEKLARTNQELEQFAYVSSHDLKEPLRMIYIYTQLLKSSIKENLSPEVEEYFGFTMQGAERMKRLIDDLLEYSRIGKSDHRRRLINLNDKIEVVRQNLSAQIAESGAKIECGNLPGIYGVPSYIVQLFQNLLGNAIKYRSKKAPVIRISAVEKAREWLFTVADNGIGIPIEYCNKIFTIFSRLHSREQYPGTGIGLSICKKIVEVHGGTIWAEPNPEGGTSFHFTIAKPPKRRRELNN